MRITTLFAIAMAISAAIWKYLEARHTSLAADVIRELDLAELFKKTYQNAYDPSVEVYTKEQFFDAAEAKQDAFERQILAKLKVLKKSKQLSALLSSLRNGDGNKADDNVQELLIAAKENASGTVKEIKKQLMLAHSGTKDSETRSRRRRR